MGKFNGTWIIEFYSPDCSHCKRLLPEFEVLAHMVELHKKEIGVGKVNCISETALERRFSIKGFPQIKLFYEGKETTYKGHRKGADIMNFVQRMMRPPITEVSSSKAMHTRIKNEQVNDSNLMGYLILSSSAIPPIYTEIAAEMQATHFFLSSDAPDLWKAYGGSATEGYAVVSLGDAEFATFEGNLGADQEEEFRSWVQSVKFPLVTELSSRNFHTVTHSGRQVALYVYEPYSKGVFMKSFKNSARKHRNRLYFASIDGITWSDGLESLGVSRELLPRLVVLESEQKRFYENPTLLTMDDVETGIGMVLDGRLEATHEGIYGIPQRIKGFFRWFYYNGKGIMMQNHFAIWTIINAVIVLIFCACYFDSGSKNEKKKPEAEKEGVEEEDEEEEKEETEKKND